MALNDNALRARLGDASVRGDPGCAAVSLYGSGDGCCCFGRAWFVRWWVPIWCCAMAFLGDALRTSILPGQRIGYIVSNGGRGPIFWWGLGTGVLTLGIVGRWGKVLRSSRIRRSASSSDVCSGIALISTMRSYAVDLSHFLFGDVLGVMIDLRRQGLRCWCLPPYSCSTRSSCPVVRPHTG